MFSIISPNELRNTSRKQCYFEELKALSFEQLRAPSCVSATKERCRICEASAKYPGKDEKILPAAI